MPWPPAPIGRANGARPAAAYPITVDGTFTGAGATQLTSSGTSAFIGCCSDSEANELWGQATASSGTAFGVVGETASTFGAGVVGRPPRRPAWAWAS